MPQNYNLFLKGNVGDWDFNADMVSYVLDKHKNSEVRVLIDSLGGYTHAAVSISSLFKLHGNVHVHFVGYNASAATIAAMGAKRITIDEDAAFLVHKCLSPVMEWAWMNADELDEHIRRLEQTKKDAETLDSCVAGMYARRCKKTKDELLELMKAGGWLTPEQALEWGFVDEITHSSTDAKPELTEAAMSTLSAAGIPLPPNYTPKKSSLMERFLAFLQTSFSSVASEAKSSEAQKSNAMPDLHFLAEAIGVLGVAESVQLSAADAVKLNDILGENAKNIDSLRAVVAEKDAQITALNATVAERDRAIADLQKEPAAATATVVDTAKDVDPYAPVSDTEALEAAKAFMNLSL